MPLNIFGLPDLLTVVASARAAMSAALPGANAYLWPNNTYPAAKAFGGMTWSAYQRLDFVGKQTFALFAEGKYLDWQGQELGLPRKQATAASGNIVVTASDVLAIASGATFVRGDGAVFATSASAALSGPGSVSVPVVGSAGAASNTEAGSPMTISSGVSGPGLSSATAAVDGSGLSDGADIEPDGLPMTKDLSTYRGRILFRKANPAQGGSPADYVTWTAALPGVTRVFVERWWNGPGTVRVFPLFDTLFPGGGGIPDSGHVAMVNAALQPLAPAGCTLTVAAALAMPVNLTVANLLPNYLGVQAAIQEEFNDAIRRLGQVGGSDPGIPGVDFLATPFAFDSLFCEQAVANASGVQSADVTAIDTTIPTGYVPVATTVVFE